MFSLKALLRMPPVIACLCFGASAGIHEYLLPRAWRHVFASPAWGSAVIALSLVVMAWAAIVFRRSRTPIRPGKQPRRLVAAGPFRFSRNPMYLGLAGVLSGIALRTGSPAMLLAPATFAAIVSAVVIPAEERLLRETFGESYTAYAERVRRWL